MLSYSVLVKARRVQRDARRASTMKGAERRVSGVTRAWRCGSAEDDHFHGAAAKETSKGTGYGDARRTPARKQCPRLGKSRGLRTTPTLHLPIHALKLHRVNRWLVCSRRLMLSFHDVTQCAESEDASAPRLLDAQRHPLREQDA
jgi:hypothetical protein